MVYIKRQVYEWIELLSCALLIVAAAVMVYAPPRALHVDNDMAAAPKSCLARVVIDAGHGGFDSGAIGIDTKIHESRLNLAVAKIVRDELLSSGVEVIMTRELDDAIGRDKDEDMANRRFIINRKDVDFVVSIHMNKFKDRSVSGPMVFYMKGSPEGKALADKLIIPLCEAAGINARQPNPGDYFVIRVGGAPAVIVECGFLSNSGDEYILQTGDYQRKLGEAIVKGIMEYVKSMEEENN